MSRSVSSRSVVLAMAVALAGAAAAPAAYDAAKWVIKEESSVYQMGMFPYLNGGGAANIRATKESCERQCLVDKDCMYGTFVTQGKSKDAATHSFSSLVRYGECWLAKETHSTQVECGVACESFSKQPKPEGTTTVAPTTTATFAPKFDPKKNYHRQPCKCDPKDHPSVFTKCKQDPFSYHILVRHLQPQFHTVPFTGGEQHKCKMISEHKCSCCDCRDDGSFYDIKEIGFGLHTAKAPFLLGGGANNVVASFDECRKLCHDNAECNAGTFISAGSSKGQCWLSSYTESEQPCEKPCHSFVKTTRLGVKGYEPPPERMPLEHCEGDCDHDAHCKTGYVCHHQDEHSPIPGCEGTPEEAMDYCILQKDRWELQAKVVARKNAV